MTTLIIGATGKQGGATAQALLAADQPIRVLVRDSEAPKARALAARGAELVRGDLDDHASLVAAASGMTSVFSIPYPDLANLAGDAELTRARNLVSAAELAGVSQFVHTSVAGAGDFSHPGWQEKGRWDRHYWDSKTAIEEIVRSAGFASWTVLKPATFMENLLEGSFLFGDWRNNGFVTAYAAQTEIPWIAVDDIGAAAAAAIIDSERFNGQSIDLVGELLTMTQSAAIISDVLGREVPAPVLNYDEARARGLHPAVISTQDYQNVRSNPTPPNLGFPLTTFKAWALQHLRQA